MKTAPRCENIDQYIGTCTATVIPRLRELRAFVNAMLPGATEGLQFGAPVFYNAKNAPVIYLYGSKKHINFGFLKSAQLTDPQGILQGSGRPSKHLKIMPSEPIDKPTLRKFIKQCEIIEP